MTPRKGPAGSSSDDPRCCLPGRRVPSWTSAGGAAPVSGGSSERSGSGRAGRGGRTKSGKPRPGTGGYGKRRLEGKGPTPPAHLRPGHPAQRRTAAAARPPDGPASDGDGRASAGRSADRWPEGRGGRARTSPAGAGGRGQRGAGDAPEVV